MGGGWGVKSHTLTKGMLFHTYGTKLEKRDERIEDYHEYLERAFTQTIKCDCQDISFT